MPRRMQAFLFLLGWWSLGSASLAYGQEGQPLISRLGIDPLNGPNPQDVSVTLQILFLLTILSLLPSIAVMTTSFIRISIVLGLVRRAIGTQQTPSNEVIVGLSLFMTFFIMTPVFEKINQTAIQPYLRPLVSGYKSNKVKVSKGEGGGIMFCASENTCKIGLFSNKVRLKICRIV